MTPLHAELTAALAASQRQVAELQQEIELLRQKVDALVKRIFGSKSEKMDPAQLELFMAGLDPAGAPPPLADAPAAAASGDALTKPPAVPPPAFRPKPARRPRLPEHLPIVEEIVDPDIVLANPAGFRFVNQVVTEQLDFKRGYFLRRHIIRRKYAPIGNPEAAPIIAPLSILQERVLAAPSLLANIITAKYCDALPLYRQEQIFKTRYNIQIPRQTMARWMSIVAFWFTGIWKEIEMEVLADGCVQCDETVIKYLDPGHGKTRRGYLWVVHRPGGDTVFHWFTSRAAACLKAIFPPWWTGVIGCDRYVCYNSYATERNHAAHGPGFAIELASCLAHIRRGFIESMNEAPIRAGWILRQIAHLYQIETRLRKNKSRPVLRQATRAAEAPPILRRLEKAIHLFESSGRHLPKSGFGQALQYARNALPGMHAYLNDGRVEIDNNLVENEIRPSAIGKKNFLFFGSGEAGKHSAILYTIVASARRRGLDPEAYLADVIRRLPTTPATEMHTLTPAAWAAEQRSKVPAIRPTSAPPANTTKQAETKSNQAA
jgi:transposase